MDKLYAPTLCNQFARRPVVFISVCGQCPEGCSESSCAEIPETVEREVQQIRKFVLYAQKQRFAKKPSSWGGL
jgi:hypothetical protein